MGSDKDKKAKFLTSSGIEIKQVYSPKDLAGFGISQDLGEPGKYPFTRGVYSTMYRGKLWTMRQYAGFGTAEESNRRYRFLLAQGQTGISVAFDLPTQLGLDSDDPISHGEVGKVGVAIDSLEDMEALFRRIPLDKISVSMTINSTAAIILAMYLALADKKGIKWSSLSGTIQNDILKEYIARGTYIFPPQKSLKIITDILAFCHKNVSNWNTMSISGYHIREAGATAVQELAFTFANAIAYVKAAIDSGLDVDTFAPRLSFFLASHNNFFEEIAKFRAARRIWARLMREEFHAKDPLSWKFRFHTQTSGVALLAQQPENNVVRVALQALASVLGGTQSLHTNSWDEALALPSEEAAQTALRTQQIIACESGVVETADPVGGSFLIESLTNQIEEKVKDYLRKIEELGGMIVAIEKGFIQKEIQESAYMYQKQIESKDQIIVGLNKYQKREDKIHYNLYSPPKAIETNQVKKIRLLKKSRSAQKVKNRLDALRKGVESDENILPLIIDAVKAKATLGEISALLKGIFGTFNETVTL